jgi:hypothetical protein
MATRIAHGLSRLRVPPYRLRSLARSHLNTGQAFPEIAAKRTKSRKCKPTGLTQPGQVEGFNDVATVFRSTAEGETGHAHGHLEYLEEVGDPATGKPIGPIGDNLKAAIASETHEYTDTYPAWPAPPARKPSTRSPAGLRPSPMLGSRTPAASKRRALI